AVAPFTDLEDAMYALAQTDMPGLLEKLHESRKDFSQAFSIASEEVGMDLAKANPITRVDRIQAPVLYVAGGEDTVAPPSDVKKLAARTPNAKLPAIPGYDHGQVSDVVVKVGPPALKLLAKVMGPSPDPTCLSTSPPEDVHYE